MSILLAFIFAIAPLSQAGLMATYEAPSQTHEALLDRPITAPSQAHLEPTEVEVGTTPAPATQAPTQAPVPAPVEAPQVDPVPLGAPGSPAPETAPHAPVEAPHAPVDRCEEDEPCWDCTMGQNECGATVEDDAWASLDTTTGIPTPQDLGINYVRTVGPNTPFTTTATQFVVPDVNHEGVSHIFEYVTELKV